jgi:hypothetical protein
MREEEKKSNLTALEKAQEALRKFWLEKSKTPVIKAKHAEIYIEPKVFVGKKLNPEIEGLIVKERLSKITPEDIAKGRIVITADKILIKDKTGKPLAEVRSKKLINNMINKITNYLGKTLAAKQSKEGTPYVEVNESGSFAFGDIKEALAQFLMDMEKNDSKNLIRDAMILLKK